MGSIPTTELIDQVERSFLCSTNRKEDLQRIPLLQEFENEMKIYQVRLSNANDFRLLKKNSFVLFFFRRLV